MAKQLFEKHKALLGPSAMNSYIQQQFINLLWGGIRSKFQDSFERSGTQQSKWSLFLFKRIHLKLEKYPGFLPSNFLAFLPPRYSYSRSFVFAFNQFKINSISLVHLTFVHKLLNFCQRGMSQKLSTIFLSLWFLFFTPSVHIVGFRKLHSHIDIVFLQI